MGVTSKPCKFPAGTKVVGRMCYTYIDAEGKPVTEYCMNGLYDKDGKRCYKSNSSDETNIVYENEVGETRMPNEVFRGYKDWDGEFKIGTPNRTSVYEIPSSVCSITEINGADDIVDVRLNVTVYNTTPPAVGKIVNLGSDDVLLVPKGSLDAYKKDSKWGKFKNISEFDMGDASSQPAASATSDLEERLKKIEARLAALEAKMK